MDKLLFLQIKQIADSSLSIDIAGEMDKPPHLVHCPASNETLSLVIFVPFGTLIGHAGVNHTTTTTTSSDNHGQLTAGNHLGRPAKMFVGKPDFLLDAVQTAPRRRVLRLQDLGATASIRLAACHRAILKERLATWLDWTVSVAAEKIIGLG
ncbi:hypothetical protein [Paraburkholderia polaris]|uniref:hypothetical protein n=1 Tax=Paraburkholderia polaris TaxID=2728848 RepID=UPI00197E7D9B|nr:hypothetical protein [Paraburkholderia polaris]